MISAVKTRMKRAKTWQVADGGEVLYVRFIVFVDT